MKKSQSRKIFIRDRVFSLANLKRVSDVFEKQLLLEPKTDQNAYITYEIHFSDNTSIESDSNEIINEGALTRPGRPVNMRFHFRNRNYTRLLDFSISHGNSTYDNYASVSSDNSSWMNDNFAELEKEIETAKPQDHWCRRHKTLLLIFIAAGVWSLFSACCNGLWLFFFRYLDKLESLEYFLIIGCSLIPSGFLLAFSIRSRLLSLWPSIELDIGSEHLKMEKKRRRRLAAVVSLLVVPIVVNVVCYLII